MVYGCILGDCADSVIKEITGEAFASPVYIKNEVKNMQRVLILEIENKKVISKPWCFEALCLINENDNNEKSSLKAYIDAVLYLFEGTPAANDVILKLPADKLQGFVNMLNKWYIEDMMELVKLKDEIPKSENGMQGGNLRDIYNSVFRAWGTMPSEIAKQPPMSIFNLLKGEGDSVTKECLPGDLKALYGM